MHSKYVLGTSSASFPNAVVGRSLFSQSRQNVNVFHHTFEISPLTFRCFFFIGFNQVRTVDWLNKSLFLNILKRLSISSSWKFLWEQTNVNAAALVCTLWITSSKYKFEICSLRDIMQSILISRFFLILYRSISNWNWYISNINRLRYETIFCLIVYNLFITRIWKFWIINFKEIQKW